MKLTERIKEINPLKIKDELINKHGFYEFKMKQFLLALAFGMRPAKIYNGTDSAVEGILLVNTEGEVLCYHKSEHLDHFADFLLPESSRLGRKAGRQGQVRLSGKRERRVLFQTECKDWIDKKIKSMNEVLKAIKSRRSVRAYTEQQISQEDLNAILEAATYAPVV